MAPMEPGSRSFQAYGRILSWCTYGLIAISTIFALTSNPPRWAATTIGALAITTAATGLPITNGYAAETRRLEGAPEARKAARGKAVTYMRLGMLVVAGMGVAFMLAI